MGHSCLSKINIFKFSNPFYSVKPECAIRVWRSASPAFHFKIAKLSDYI